MGLTALLTEIKHLRRVQLGRVEEVIPISIVLLLFSFGWGVVGPFFYIHFNNLLQDAELLGLFIGLWGLVRIFTDPVVGMIIDVQDIKRTLIISLLAYSIIGIAYYFTTNVQTLFLIRVLHSITGSFFWVSAWAYTYKKTLPNRREEDLMFERMVSLIPSLFAPLIGGLIVTYFGTNQLFLAVTLATLIGAFYFMKKGEPIKGKQKKISELLRTEFSSFKKLRKQLLILLLLITPITLISQAYSSFLPIFVEQSHNSEMVAIITVVSVLPSILVFPIGKKQDEKMGSGKTQLLMIGMMIITMSLFFLPLMNNIIFQLGVILILASGFALVVPTTNALVGDMMGEDRKAGYVGLVETFKDFGTIIGPIIGGALIKSGGFTTFFNTLAIISIGVIGLTFTVKKFNK